MLIVVSSQEAYCGVWRVNPQGTGDVSTIQEAFDAAASQDTILLAPGAYGSGTITLQNKGILIRGEEGPESTILDGGFDGRVLLIEQTGAPVILEQLTLQNGVMNVLDEHGGGIAVFDSDLIVKGCVFRNNWANGGLGGAIYAAGSPFAAGSLTATGCTFEDNRAFADGGAVFGEDVVCHLVDCTFRGNRAVVGGGVGILHLSHLLRRCTFENNTAKIAGGGFYYSGDGTVELEDVLFANNTAEDFGGGLRVVSGFGVTLRRAWFVNNSALHGGGASVTLTPVEAEYVLWFRGTAGDEGGGIHLDQVPASSFLRCTWLENTSPVGASFFVRSGAIDVTRCIVGDEDTRAAFCTGAPSVTSNCNLGGKTTGQCLTFERRVSVQGCESSPQALCTLESSSCGTAGHADETCLPSDCQTPVEPISWGRLKILYR